jgi:hypothetical protein
MRSLQRKINVSQKKQEKKINVDNRYRYDIQKGTFTQQYVQLSVFFIKLNIKHTALIILTLIMGVVNSTMKDGTLSSDGQNE